MLHRHKSLLLCMWPGVLFLVRFNGFDQTMSFYWSCMLLFKLPILMHSWSITDCSSTWQLVEVCNVPHSGGCVDKPGYLQNANVSRYYLIVQECISVVTFNAPATCVRIMRDKPGSVFIVRLCQSLSRAQQKDKTYFVSVNPMGADHE